MTSETTQAKLSSPLLTGDLLRPESLRFIHTLRHHPHWQKAIIEALSRYSAEQPENAARLIRTTILCREQPEVYAPSECEDILYRDLLLAPHCLGGTARPDTALIHEVSSRLLRTFFPNIDVPYYSDNPRRNTIWALKKRICGALRVLSHAAPELIEQLAREVQNPKGHADVRSSAAFLLEEIGALTPESLDALVAVARNPKTDYDLLCSTIDALSTCRQAAPEVLDALTYVLQYRAGDGHLLYRTLTAVTALKAATPEIIDALLDILYDEEREADDRIEVAVVLFRLDEVQAEDMEVLLTVLEGGSFNEDPHCPDDLPAQTDPEVIQVVYRYLRRVPKDSYALQWVIEIIEQWGEITPEIYGCLMRIAGDYARSPIVRYLAGRALLKRMPTTPEILSIVRDFSQAEDSSDTWMHCQLIENGFLPEKITPDVIAFLLDMAQDGGQNERARSGAIRALAQLKAATPEIIETLIMVAQEPEDLVASNAVAVLSRLGQATSEIVGALVAIVQNREANMVARITASCALGRLNTGTEEVISALWSFWLEKDLNIRGRMEAVYALRNLGQDISEIVQELVTMVQDTSQDVWAHSHAIMALGDFGAKNTEVIKALRERIVPRSYDGDLDRLSEDATIALSKLNPIEAEMIAVVREAYLRSSGNADIWEALWDMCQRYEEQKAADIAFH